VVDYLLQIRPKESGLNYLAGLAYAQKKEPEQAMAYFEKVKPKHPFFVNAAIQMGILLHEQGDINAAIEHLEGAVLKKSDDTKLYRYLGFYYEQQKRYPQAIEVLKKGLQVDSENVDLLYRMGIVQDKMGQWQAGVATMQKILAFDPDNSSALNFIGYSYADQGVRLDEAEALIKRALEQKPNDGFILDSLGWVYYKKGEYKKALEAMLKSVEHISDDPTILEHLGDVYQKMQQPQKALEYYRQALKHEPSDPATVQQKIDALQ
jgi:tetratricopeptide (TPR) repeat protein